MSPQSIDFSMSYLENPFCTLTPLFDFNPDKKYDIISISLFKMPGGGYKDYDRYIDGIFGLLHKKKKKFPNFKIRVFADEQVLKDPELSWLKDRCQVVKYSCADFLNEDGFHKGTFGTFLRFFPAYDFPNNDARHVVVLDADIKPDEIDTMSKAYFHLHEIPKLHLYYFGVTNNLSKSLLNPHLFPHAVAGRALYFDKLPQAYLVDMLQELKVGKLEMRNYYGEKSASRGEGSLRYGVDEFYLNQRLIPRCIKDNKMISFYFSYHIAAIPFVLRRRNPYPQGLKDMISYALGKHYDKKQGIKFNLSKFDRLTYKNYNKSPLQEYVTKRFYYLLRMMERDNSYKLVDKRMVDTALKVYRGIASGDGIGFSNPKQPFIPYKGIAQYNIDDEPL